MASSRPSLEPSTCKRRKRSSWTAVPSSTGSPSEWDRRVPGRGIGCNPIDNFCSVVIYIAGLRLWWRHLASQVAKYAVYRLQAEATNSMPAKLIVTLLFLYKNMLAYLSVSAVMFCNHIFVYTVNIDRSAYDEMMYFKSNVSINNNNVIWHNQT